MYSEYIYIFKLSQVCHLAGAPKRTADPRSVVSISCSEWFKLPSCLFKHAWISTGLVTQDEMSQLSGLSEEELQQDVPLKSHLPMHLL